MPSPFPGMDPYLEEPSQWGGFQHQMIGCLYQMLLPGLIDRYRARVTQRVYTTQTTLFTSIVTDHHHDELIEIRQKVDDRLVTLIELPTPTNKVSKEGRAAYLRHRQQVRLQHANIVEIDLVLQGEPLLDYSRDGLPDWDYAISVTRASSPDRYEIYTTTMHKRLPRFKVPLAADDRDTILDLQACLMRCYDMRDFGTSINYQVNPNYPLSEGRLESIDQILKAGRMR